MLITFRPRVWKLPSTTRRYCSTLRKVISPTQKFDHIRHHATISPTLGPDHRLARTQRIEYSFALQQLEKPVGCSCYLLPFLFAGSLPKPRFSSRYSTMRPEVSMNCSLHSDPTWVSQPPFSVWFPRTGHPCYRQLTGYTYLHMSWARPFRQPWVRFPQSVEYHVPHPEPREQLPGTGDVKPNN